MAMSRSHRRRVIAAFSMATAGVLALSACAGAASGAAGSDAAGFEYGASQEDVEAAIADLEPVSLVYQPGAMSQVSDVAPVFLAFSEAVEERSGGKITFDTVWGQAIAGYDEVVDALADGRVDVAFALPIYNPSEFAALSNLIGLSSALPSSPMAGDMVANATILELAFGSEDVMSAFEEQGVTALGPVFWAPSVYPVCTQPGHGLDDFAGRQARIASAPQSVSVEALGATPVSLAYTEAFEALQRNTINCTVTDLPTAKDMGFLEVAPNISYSPDLGMPRGAGSFLAGAKFETLPLPYRQILFDAYRDVFSESVKNSVDAYPVIVENALSVGGEVGEFTTDATEALAEAKATLLAEVQATGYFGDDVQAKVAEIVSRWEATTAELGFEDGGELGAIAKWHEPGSRSFDDFAQAVFENVMLDHRP